MMRKFERCKGFEDVNLPVRKTSLSAGYDFESAEDAFLEPGKVTIIKTGIKAYMESDEYLCMAIRSGLSIKNALSLINGVGVIDADYVDNADNEGNICIPIINLGDKPFVIKKGNRIAQGIFHKFQKTDNDETSDKHIRVGGTGSTGL